MGGPEAVSGAGTATDAGTLAFLALAIVVVLAVVGIVVGQVATGL